MNLHANAPRPLVIAHRGACAYLPEHTLEAKALAYGMGADFLEQDVVATRDDQLVVLHDIHVDTVTNVAEKFPDRARDDGRFYVRDFDLAELRTLNVHERREADGRTAVFPQRFPTDSGRFSIASLADELAMITGMNKATGQDVGIYPEVKSPAWHLAEGVDVSRLLLNLLRKFGYTDRDHAAFVQCFDADEVRRIRRDLNCDLKIIQLIGDNSWGEAATDYDELRTVAGLKRVAQVADGIGPWISHLYGVADIDGHPVSSGLVSAAHDAGLDVHPYTFRADSLPDGFDNFAELLRYCVEILRVDGLFTDFPDKVLKILANG